VEDDTSPGARCCVGSCCGHVSKKQQHILLNMRHVQSGS
jgi:hypothetical protein